MQLNPKFYTFVAFIGGLTIMAIEITAARIMGPYFGTSIFIWTNILGVIMLALAIGYWLGGKIADKYPVPKVFFTIVLIASILILALPFLAPTLLENLSARMVEPDSSLIIFSLLASLVLFFIPFGLLGMISPYLIRLVNRQVEQTGRVAGKIFAVSTIGSIVGTFLPTLVTVPLFGVQRTIVVFGAALCITAAIGLAKKEVYIALVVLTAGGLIASPWVLSTENTLAYTESPYSYIEVRDFNGAKALTFSKNFSIQSLERPNSVLTGGYYWDYFNLLPGVFCQEACDIAIIGVAGGTIARQLDYFYADKTALAIDGIELDPTVTEMARQHFQYDIPSLTTHHSDGRMWLRLTDRQYDIIILDAFTDVEIPAHLTSNEFFALAKQQLNEAGVLAINIGVPNPDVNQYQRFLTTLQNNFDYVWDIGMPSSANRLVFATDNTIDFPEALRYANRPAELDGLFTYAAESLEMPENYRATLITDDLPLTEMLYDIMLYQGYYKNK
ncbi:spermidine synthase [Patescibacteria group bacterium]